MGAACEALCVLHRLFCRCRLLSGVQDMQFLTRFEAYSFTRSNIHFRPCAGIAPDAGLPWPDIEDAETAKFNAVSVRQGFLEAFKYGVDCGLGFHTRQSGAFDYVMDDVLFNQCLHPETLVFFWATSMLW